MNSGGAAVTLAPRRHGVNYGWWVVAGSFAGVMVSFAPLVVFPFGLFLKELTAAFGWTRAEVSLAFSLAALTVAVASPLLGKAADRWGARRIILLCAPTFGLLIASLNRLTPSLWHLYAVFIAIGAVANGAAHLTYARIVSCWFDRRRGLALSLVMSGVGVGATVMPVAAERLIREVGWRGAYLMLGLTAAALATPLAAFVLRDHPSEGDREERVPRGLGSQGAVETAWRWSTFFSLMAAFFLLSVGANGCIAHLAALLTDRGLGTQTAALATSLVGGASLAGRLLTGGLLDRFSAPRVGFVFVMGSVAGTLLLTSGSVAAAAGAAVLIGLAMGAEADLMPYLIGRYCGLRRFGELYGYAFTAYAVAGAVGPFLMGFLYDSTGSYRTALFAFAATTALAAMLIVRLPACPSTGR
jgi:MFS family permease